MTCHSCWQQMDAVTSPVPTPGRRPSLTTAGLDGHAQLHADFDALGGPNQLRQRRVAGAPIMSTPVGMSWGGSRSAMDSPMTPLGSVAVPIAPNIYSWFIVSSNEPGWLLIRLVVLLFVVLQASALYLMLGDFAPKDGSTPSSALSLLLHSVWPNGTSTLVSSGIAITLPHLHPLPHAEHASDILAASPAPTHATLSLQASASPVPLPLATLCAARFLGHFFLVLRVTPTMLDVVRALVVWASNMRSERGLASTSWLTLARTVVFAAAVLYVVASLFLLTTAMMFRGKSIYDVLRAGLSIVFVFEAHKNLFDLLCRMMKPPKFEIHHPQATHEDLAERCQMFERVVTASSLLFPFLELLPLISPKF